MKAPRAFAGHFLALTLGLIFVTQAEAAEIDLIDGLSPGQKAILIRGPITSGDDERFYQLTKGMERASVFLESPGGVVDAGISIGAEIAMRGFTTLVLDGEGCHSVCAVIWVSGARRYMSPNASISVHAAYRVSGKAATDTELVICASPDLWAMDRAVSNLYFLFRRAAASAERTAFLDDQRAWLARRNACGGLQACLMERYSSRLFDMGF